MAKSKVMTAQEAISKYCFDGMTVLLPGGTRQVVCCQEFVLEETLLSGQVPMLYGG